MFTLRAILAMTSLSLLTCLPAAAQYRPERPYRGIFASGIDAVGQSLTTQATLSGGYDDNVLAGSGFQSANLFRSQHSGRLAQLSAGINYQLVYERASFSAGAGSSFRYYPSLSDDVVDTHNVRIGGVMNVARKPNITVHGTASYQPYTFFSAYPESDPLIVEPAAPPDPEYVPVATQYVSYRAGANLDQRISRRTTFSSTYGYYTANRLERDFWRQGVGAHLDHSLTRDLSVRLGYYYNEGHYDDRVYGTHRPELSLNLNRALSLTRNTKVSFGAGTTTTVIQGEVRTRLHAIGNVRITHEMGRSWTLTGVYDRGIYYVETLPEPVFANTMRASLVGLITRRLQFHANAYASIGDSGFSGNRPYNVYQGSVGLSSALTRFMQVGVTYASYHYDFDDQIRLDPGVPQRVDRQSIRGYVTLWAPILNRTRRPDAAR